eukprot:278356_1
MENAKRSYEAIVADNLRLKKEIENLRKQFPTDASPPHDPESKSSGITCPFSEHALNNAQIRRYGRHLILPQIGAAAQARICAGSVLVIGAGGLGSPVLQYLAAAGVGRIGIVDDDVVDETNLHRQVIHSEAWLNRPKVDSAAHAISQLNSLVTVETHRCRFDVTNATKLSEQYDLMVDCSDNPATRYLASDTAVRLGKTLVSAAAVGTEGQLTVYNFRGGPCIRCLFPRPPPHQTVRNCSDSGVFGPVPGALGVLQALEALKILGDFGEVLSEKLLLFDAMTCSFRCVRLRARMPDCAMCGSGRGESAEIQEDYISPPCSITAQSSGPSVTCPEYSLIRTNGTKHVLLDVRAPVQFEICALSNAVNIPLSRIDKDTSGVLAELDRRRGESQNSAPVYVMCRRGISSVKATELLLKNGVKNVFNVKGG